MILPGMGRTGNIWENSSHDLNTWHGRGLVERWRTPNPAFSDWVDKGPVKEVIKVGMSAPETFLVLF